MGIRSGRDRRRRHLRKNITFAVAIDLARLLRSTRSFRIALTRGADEYVRLRERVARARAFRADLFLSIHANALPNPEKRGLSVFTLSTKASDREAAALADSENRDVVVGGRLAREPREIGAILVDLLRRETDNESRRLAREVVASLASDTELLENPERSAGFVVLTAPEIPSVLVELGCLSNPVEEKLLERPSYANTLRAVSHMQSRLISADTAAPEPSADSAGSRKTIVSLVNGSVVMHCIKCLRWFGA
jgi:N-acetylmuramoyl-L-alanine amidase